MTHLRYAAALLVAACALLALSACGGSNSRDPGKAAEAALLTLGDMPSGWKEQPADQNAEGNLDARFEQKLEECSGRTKGQEWPGQVAAATSKDLAGPNDESASTESTVFDTDESAQSALEEIGRAFPACRQTFIDLATSALTEGVAGTGQTPESLGLSVTFNEQELVDAGDDQRGYRLLLSVERFDLAFVLDFAFIRRGRVNGTLFYFGSKGDELQRRDIATKFDGKLQAADARFD